MQTHHLRLRESINIQTDREETPLSTKTKEGIFTEAHTTTIQLHKITSQDLYIPVLQTASYL